MNKYQWNMVVLNFVLIIILYLMFAFSNFYHLTAEKDLNNSILFLEFESWQQDMMINDNIDQNQMIDKRLDSISDAGKRNDVILHVLTLDVYRHNKKLAKKNAMLETKLLKLSQAFEKHLALDSLK